MERLDIRAADIHTRATAYGFEAFQYLNILCCVAADFLSPLCHLFLLHQRRIDPLNTLHKFDFDGTRGHQQFIRPDGRSDGLLAFFQRDSRHRPSQMILSELV
jgi:hypothetical protein